MIRSRRSNLTSRTATATLIAYLLSCALLYVPRIPSRLFQLTEVGQSDSYVVYDSISFQNTGQIYRDTTQPPYLPSIYSPLVYVTFAAAQRLFGNSDNIFLGPRILGLMVYALTVALVVSLTRALVPGRYGGVWSVLLAFSLSTVGFWPLRARGDLLGCLFGLAAVRLLISRRTGTTWLAGLCAGFATQFKLTWMAALIAGVLWLLIRRKRKELVAFLFSGFITSAGVYLFFLAREPRMLTQILTLSHSVSDIHGWARQTLRAAVEPVLLMAAAALPFVASRNRPRFALLLTFALTSFIIGSLTDIQAGGSLNYFIGAHFAAIPIAVVGAYRIIGWSGRNPWFGLCLVGLIVTLMLPGSVRRVYHSRSEADPRYVIQSRNAFNRVATVLRGRHILSTVPSFAIIDPKPALLEPFLMDYLWRAKGVLPTGILRSLRDQEFDIVITPSKDSVYRGISSTGKPVLDAALSEAYEPYCTRLGMVFHVPRLHPQDPRLTQDLRGAGCVPY